ncbi:hypothetical protein ABZ557_27385 [Streptomyces sp. NPDC019645]|uniref:hypothetical protein n=1 Tax=Streptomyces sp. NPDC019645 TaxID=3154786 RepID=UPI0033D64634
MPTTPVLKKGDQRFVEWGYPGRRWVSSPAMGVVALGTQKPKREVDSFDLTGPAFGLGAGSTGDEVGFEVV